MVNEYNKNLFVEGRKMKVAYTYPTEEATDEEVMEYIEQERLSYYQDWQSYTRDFD